MDTVLFDKNYKMDEQWETVDDAVGQKFFFKTRIPFKQKQEFAEQLAKMVIHQDEETNVMYEGFYYDMIFANLFMKYYTNIDVSKMNTAKGKEKVYDYVVFHNVLNLAKGISKGLEDDLDIIERMYGRIVFSACKINEERNGLSHLIKNSFGSILNGGDVAEEQAKNKEVNDDMINLIGTYLKEKKAQENKPVLGDRNVINFAKKKN